MGLKRSSKIGLKKGVLRNSGSTNITSGSPTAIIWDTRTDASTTANWTSGTRFTITEPGWYYINFGVPYAAAATAHFIEAYVRKNGSGVYGPVGFHSNMTQTVAISGSFMDGLVAGDYLELVVEGITGDIISGGFYINAFVNATKVANL